MPIFYYSKVKNVGDILNLYIVEKVSGRKTFLIKTKKIPHLLPIGSIMHFATKKSRVWGSGIIEPSQVPSVETLSFMKFYAVRGELTKSTLQQAGVLIDEIVLGDPAILLPEFYEPKKPLKKYKLGIVPHYVDLNNEILRKYALDSNILIINVKQNPEDFVDQLVLCDYVISSSLHGLILSDAYNIPNVWIRLSEAVTGGNFKFIDYYTTTDRFAKNIPIKNDREPVLVKDHQTIELILKDIDRYCRVNTYLYDKKVLAQSFPKRML